MDTAGDYKEDVLSSFSNGEDESSSVGDLEEEETDQQEVGEIVKAFSTMAFCSVS